MRNGKVVLLVGLVAIGVLAACSKSSGGGSATSPAGGGSVPGAVDVSGKSKVVIVMSDFMFTPANLVGTPGQEIQIELKNTSQTQHNFTIQEPGLSLNQDIAPGGDQFVTVKIPASGTVPFWCSYHKSSGMTGTLGAA